MPFDYDIKSGCKNRMYPILYVSFGWCLLKMVTCKPTSNSYIKNERKNT